MWGEAPAKGSQEEGMTPDQVKLVQQSFSKVAPIADQDSSLMSAFEKADCLLVRPARAPALPAGPAVPVIPLDF